jgi:hypothetical protein
MGHTNLYHSLEKKYAALTGELEHIHAKIARIEREQAKLPDLQSRIAELQELIESAAKLLQGIYPTWTPDQTDPVIPWTHTQAVPYGQCGRRALEVIRDSNVPVTTRQIAVKVLQGIGLKEPDRETVRKTIIAVEASLRSYRGKTIESSGKFPMQWRSIINPDIEFVP